MLALKCGFIREKKKFKKIMLQPKKTKYRKQFRGKMKGKSFRGSQLSFGEFGLKAVNRGWVSARQIEAARKKLLM